MAKKPPREKQKRQAEGRHSELERFKGANSDLPIAFDGCTIWFENPDGHIRLRLELGEDVALDAIKEHWRLIKEWQRRLLKWQGPWTGGGDRGLLAQLDTLKRSHSYNGLADKLNASIVRELAAYVAYEREFEKARPSFKTERDVTLWHWWGIAGVNPFGLDHAVDLLKTLGINDEDAKDWLDEMLDNLRADREPFPAGEGPITKDHVRERLRHWRKRHRGVEKTG